MRMIYLILFIFLIQGCGDKLDLKPNSRLVIPKTISDFENILDNASIMNNAPALAQLSADEYHIPTLANFQALSRPILRATYIWEKDIFQGFLKPQDWTVPYSQIFYANNVLNEISKLDISSDTELQRITGWALFSRAYAFYTLVSLYAKGYNSESASNDLGLPLKLSPLATEVVPRSSLQQTYDQIIKDATEASELLQPNITIGKRNRPSKVAAYSLLSRVYLSMRKYTQAELYADKSLALYNVLTDYNTLPVRTSTSFSNDCEEVIYYANMRNNIYQQLTYATGALYTVLPSLINSYETGDLRKTVWFRQNANGNWYIKGINSGNAFPFTGLATDEIFLIKAECLARRNETQDAMDHLNKLLKTRWNPNAFTPARSYQNISAINPVEALDKVLLERRKELIWRSTRWTDLKRLNLESRNIVLNRNIEGQIYTLEPNSSKYVLPIPDDEIALSGVQQNLRY